jgi:hypothetical protein
VWVLITKNPSPPVRDNAIMTTSREKRNKFPGVDATYKNSQNAVFFNNDRFHVLTGFSTTVKNYKNYFSYQDHQKPNCPPYKQYFVNFFYKYINIHYTSHLEVFKTPEFRSKRPNWMTNRDTDQFG